MALASAQRLLAMRSSTALRVVAYAHIPARAGKQGKEPEGDERARPHGS